MTCRDDDGTDQELRADTPPGPSIATVIVVTLMIVATIVAACIAFVWQPGGGIT